MSFKKLEGEGWQDIPGYEKLYKISNYGRVKSCGRYTSAGRGLRRVPEKLMTQTIHPQTGHLRVQLSKDHKTKTFIVCKLVLEAFGAKEPKGHTVCHLDGNRENNLLENLRWVPPNFSLSGEKHKNATLNNKDINEIKMLRKAGMSVDQIASKMQISKGQISKITRKKARLKN